MAIIHCKRTVKRGLVTLLTAGLIGIIPSISSAQTISVGQQAAQNQNMNKPKQGMSMSLVKKMFGNPRSTTKPVGHPPITRWYYEYFTVYFEGNYVIHSVLNRVGQPAPTPPSK